MVKRQIKFSLSTMRMVAITILSVTPLLMLLMLRFMLPLDVEANVQRLNSVYWIIFATVILVMGCIVLGIAVFSQKHLVRPLAVLSRRARGYTDGVPVLVRERFSIKEIDHLAKSVNDLMDTVMSREEALHQLNETLEETVFERTRTLENTIDNLRTTREQLLLSEKMAALGSLVTGVAHEINTPMSIGVTAASFLSERTGILYGEWDSQMLTQENLERYLKDTQESSRIIQMNLDHAARIINSLKQVAIDQQMDEYREFELESYIRDILLSLKYQLKEGKHTISADTNGVLMVNTFPGVITQILNNLVFNSVAHGFENREGGHISINSRADGEEVVLNYCDNGRGLTEEETERIFDPFFTTRRGRGGTGLGMNIVQDLVSNRLGGSIALAPPGDGGAGFRMRFPKDCTTIETAGREGSAAGGMI